MKPATTIVSTARRSQAAGLACAQPLATCPFELRSSQSRPPAASPARPRFEVEIRSQFRRRIQIRAPIQQHLRQRQPRLRKFAQRLSQQLFRFRGSATFRRQAPDPSVYRAALCSGLSVNACRAAASASGYRLHTKQAQAHIPVRRLHLRIQRDRRLKLRDRILISLQLHVARPQVVVRLAQIADRLAAPSADARRPQKNLRLPTHFSERRNSLIAPAGNCMLLHRNRVADRRRPAPQAVERVRLQLTVQRADRTSPTCRARTFAPVIRGASLP